MTVAERMAHRLATTPVELHGTPCFSCGTTALACQHTFVTTDEREHCCPPCRTLGAREAHA